MSGVAILLIGSAKMDRIVADVDCEESGTPIVNFDRDGERGS
jgi:hypothetical protein